MPAEETILSLLDRVKKIICNKCGLVVDVEGVDPFTLVTCPHCEHDKLPVPGLLGQFVLFKVMGTGAMGAVYQGFDQTLKRHVAIKVMLTNVAEEAQFIENFLREAQVLAKLNHVNVVQIYTCGQAKGQPYIVMELVDGQRLDDLMQPGKPLSEVRVLEIGIDIANGLRAAYEIGLIHGDIKPQNILMDRKNTAKVVDFGLAKPTRDQSVISEVWGTPYYIAPEKARKQKEDHRADIYSLGASLYHALTSEPPFEGETARDVVLARLEHPAPSVHEQRPDVSKSTADLIARMLEADPFRRYPTYDSLLADMHRALEAARQGPRLAPQASRKSKKTSTTKIVVSFSAALVILILVGIGLGLLLKKQNGKQNGSSSAPAAATVIRRMEGRLVRVPLPSANLPMPADPTGPIVLFDTNDDRGADTYIEGGERQDENFGSATVLRVNAPAAGKVEDARKIYLRFDLSRIKLYRTDDAHIALAVAESPEGLDSWIFKLWGVDDMHDPVRWFEGEGGAHKNISGPVNWVNAPANDPKDPTALTSPAELLVETKLGPSKPGDLLVFKNSDSVRINGLIAFLRVKKGSLANFVVTMEPGETPGSGWGFASRRHPDLQAPVAILVIRGE